MKEPIFYSIPNFHINTIELWYPIKVDMEDIASFPILFHLLMKTNYNYKTEESFQKELLRRYIRNIGVERASYGKQEFLKFYMVLPDQSVIQDVDINNCLDFFLETIYQPNIVDSTFPQDDFEREKEQLKKVYDNSIKNRNQYTIRQVIKQVDTDGFLKMGVFHHPEMIDLLTNEQLYQCFNKYIVNKKPMIFLAGHESIKSLIPRLKEYFKKSELMPINQESNCYLKRQNGPLEMVEKKPYQQSTLAVVYKIPDMKAEEQLKFFVMKNILSSNSSKLLFEKLRTEAGLVYSTNVDSYSHFGMIILYAEFEKNSKEEVLSIIKDVVHSLQDNSVIEDRLELIKEGKRINLLRQKDSFGSILADKIESYLGLETTLEEDYQIIKNYKVEDISEFSSRLQLDFVYYLEGDIHE